MAKRWSDQEDDFILDHYSAEGLAWVTENLPGRTRAGIVKRAGQLGVKSRHWSEAEDYVIALCYEQYGAAYCRQYMPKRTEIAIMSRARRIGVLRDRKQHNRGMIDSHDEIGCLQAAFKIGLIAKPHHLPEDFYKLTVNQASISNTDE
ncbi:MAG: hypothetical protein N0C84_22485 [Candidatus Thiodiazotropha taylori]|uniref:Uncharacterized protein n=1 Tax=Candidatus Thiodiazotropha taylori TaxID=2792791 RepID=A0A9E4N7W1_9GAMM|nr:hypothetical protein [Candidatus Thiodiazotropha taylori]MCW4259236.1 hypothetical protein [Candidatus Thiodiazotropha taylori]